ncbi:hypothetical protein Hdeb2414_s0457g00897891 [Helianthus debilis subsp. tardiflorus]
MWYYDGCNHCKFKVEQKFETYDKKDGTSDVRDEKVYQCSNKDCQGKDVFLLSRFNQYGDTYIVWSRGVEVCCENCKGTFINLGRVTDFNIVNAVENYGISVVTNDVDILDELNKKWKIDQLDVSDSFAMSQSDFQSAGGESEKDGVSYIGDNSTPVSKDYVADLNQSSAEPI